MQILKQHWESTLIDLVKSANERIYLSSPFIKETVVDLIVDNKNDGIDCKLLTKFTLPNMNGSGLDLSAVQKLKDNGFSLKSIGNLHAKIFIFDNQAIITSANLTNGGLHRNLEYGVLLENENEIENDFLGYYNDKKYQHIENEHILKAQDLLSKLPKIENSKKIGVEMPIFAKDLEQNLSTGNQKVFSGIEQLNLENFTTLAINNQLKGEFNNSKEPDRTIARNLQELRDIGLLEFTSRGNYRKLWN
ncbi:MAG: hypothetical protein Ctma_0861 [Catillopecten margaritatus gill symbiont]|uniref:PLD phosphodiesterase domain-containing protein n=1 Tax=Catillopecten margaritatus gill symbiont TaxID=3083288 RepID=A0AAU6PGI5_9GAMM